CPFTLVRDWGRKFLPAATRWPRALRNKWLAAALFITFLWAYEAFSLWDSPAATAWIILGYFAAALVVDGLFRGASFCKYVCPIGQFHFVASLISPKEVGVRKQATCESCKTHDCIRGNEDARGCELYLFQPKKAGNLDCTFCLDCVKACPHDNVTLVSIAPASTISIDPYRSSVGRMSKRTDLTVMALLVVFGAFVSAAGMVSPVMTWEHGWHARLGANAMPLVVGIFTLLGLIFVPALAISACAAANRLFGQGWNVARRFVLALVPIGIGMWAAHMAYHFGTGWDAAWPTIERAIGVGTTAAPPTVLSWLSGAQLILLDGGLLLTLYVAWRIAKQSSSRLRSTVAIAMPWIILSFLLYGAGVWILLQPMQMRGMVH
ncbi:MAG: hypothetical protein JO108_05655, partial [Acidobacteriaceae bacterium]|nr:hypothetical protein [Acidobacteriaceae bacterium]